MDREILPIVEITMNQYNMKQDLNRSYQSRFGAIEKEERQLVTMDFLEPDNPKELIREDRRNVMAFLVFLKERHDGTIKA